MLRCFHAFRGFQASADVLIKMMLFAFRLFFTALTLIFDYLRRLRRYQPLMSCRAAAIRRRYFQYANMPPARCYGC